MAADQRREEERGEKRKKRKKKEEKRERSKREEEKREEKKIKTNVLPIRPKSLTVRFESYRPRNRLSKARA